MAKAMGSFRDSLAPSWLSSPRADVPADPPSHMPCIIYLSACTRDPKQSYSDLQHFSWRP
jgi:hypothetical protein